VKVLVGPARVGECIGSSADTTLWGFGIDGCLVPSSPKQLADSAGNIIKYVRKATGKASPTVALFSSDPGINRAIEKSAHGMEGFKNALIAILAGPDPDVAARVTAMVALTGVAMAGGSPDLAELDDETLRRELVDVGRRLMGRPRRR